MAQQKQRKKPILTDGKNIFTYCFTTNTKFVLLQLRQRKFWNIHIQILTNFKKNSYSTNFVHFIHHQFVHFIDPEKPVRGLMNNFVHFIHPYMNSLPNEYC